jgi:hypothetical protein
MQNRLQAEHALSRALVTETCSGNETAPRLPQPWHKALLDLAVDDLLPGSMCLNQQHLNSQQLNLEHLNPQQLNLEHLNLQQLHLEQLNLEQLMLSGDALSSLKPQHLMPVALSPDALSSCLTTQHLMQQTESLSPLSNHHSMPPTDSLSSVNAHHLVQPPDTLSPMRWADCPRVPPTLHGISSGWRSRDLFDGQCLVEEWAGAALPSP